MCHATHFLARYKFCDTLSGHEYNVMWLSIIYSASIMGSGYSVWSDRVKSVTPYETWVNGSHST